LFRRDDMSVYDRLPEDLRIIGASDFAATPDGGDWTEHGIAGVSEDGTIYLIDWWRGQTGPEVWIERLLDMIAKHRPLAWYGEMGPIRRSTEGRIRQRQIDRRTPCRIEWLPTAGSKETRAQSIIATAGMSRLLWPRAGWVAELQRQCLVFPAGSPDDGVDTLGLLGRGADGLGRKAVSSPVKMEDLMPTSGMMM
jgi:predicted phage terminase large subunit-like protein